MQADPGSSPRGAGRWTANPAFAAVEDAFAAYQEAWGGWMVGHHRGAPVDPADGGDEDLAGRLLAARSALGEQLARLDPSALDPDDAAALVNLHGSLPELDAWAAPLDGRAFTDLVAPAGHPSAGDGAREDPEVASLRRATFDAWGGVDPAVA